MEDKSKVLPGSVTGVKKVNEKNMVVGESSVDSFKPAVVKEVVVEKEKKAADKVEIKQDSPVGVYVNLDEHRVVMIYVLKADGTCGMFMMPTQSEVIYSGFTVYIAKGNTLRFQVQLIPTGNIESRKPGANDEKFLEAVFEPGRGFKLAGQMFGLSGLKMDLWNKKNWKEFGESRVLEGQEDFDYAHEIRQAILAVINRFGGEGYWAGKV